MCLVWAVNHVAGQPSCVCGAWGVVRHGLCECACLRVCMLCQLTLDAIFAQLGSGNGDHGEVPSAASAVAPGSSVDPSEVVVSEAGPGTPVGAAVGSSDPPPSALDALVASLLALVASRSAVPNVPQDLTPCGSPPNFLLYRARGPTPADSDAINSLLEQLHPLVATIQGQSAAWVAALSHVHKTAEDHFDTVSTSECDAVMAAGSVRDRSPNCPL